MLKSLIFVESKQADSSCSISSRIHQKGNQFCSNSLKMAYSISDKAAVLKKALNQTKKSSKLILNVLYGSFLRPDYWIV